MAMLGNHFKDLLLFNQCLKDIFMLVQVFASMRCLMPDRKREGESLCF